MSSNKFDRIQRTLGLKNFSFLKKKKCFIMLNEKGYNYKESHMIIELVRNLTLNSVNFSSNIEIDSSVFFHDVCIMENYSHIIRTLENKIDKECSEKYDFIINLSSINIENKDNIDILRIEYQNEENVKILYDKNKENKSFIKKSNDLSNILIGNILSNFVILYLSENYPKNNYLDFKIPDYSVNEKFNILLVGCGATGSEYIKYFMVLDMIKKITLVDNDTIEESNITRQFLYQENDVGKYKSEVIYNKIKKNVKCQYFNNKIEDCQIKDFSEYDLIISSLDNIDARQYLDHISEKLDIPFVDCGLYGLNGSTYICKNNNYLRYSEYIKNFDNEVTPSCTIKNNPQNINHCVEWALDYMKNNKNLDLKELKDLYQQKCNQNFDEKLCKEIKKKYVYLEDNIYDKNNQDHLESLTLLSNMKATIFNIKKESQFEINRIGGKIIPSIITTASHLCGLNVLEIINNLENNYQINFKIPKVTSNKCYQRKKDYLKIDSDEIEEYCNKHKISNISIKLDKITYILFDKEEEINFYPEEEKMYLCHVNDQEKYILFN